MFSFTNFVTPGTIYHGTVSTSGGGLPVGSRGSATASPTATVKLEVFHETKVPGISSDDFETKQVRFRNCGGMFPLDFFSFFCPISRSTTVCVFTQLRLGPAGGVSIYSWVYTPVRKCSRL